MVNIRLGIFGAEKVVRQLSRIGNLVQDFKEPMYLISNHFFQVNKENFEAGGKPKRFAPLSSGYKLWKRKNYPGKKIMQLTDRLMNSLTGENQADSQDTIRIITSKYMELGTRVPYAAAHYYGYPKRNLPARKIIQITEKHKQVWVRIIQRWAFGLFEKAGFDVTKEEIGGSI